MRLARQPLIRLLAVNLLGGAAVAGLMLCGLLALNPGNLRGLILADRAPATAAATLGHSVTTTRSFRPASKVAPGVPRAR